MLGTNKNPYPYNCNRRCYDSSFVGRITGNNDFGKHGIRNTCYCSNSAGPREFIISGINGYLVVPEVDKIVKLILSDKKHII